MYMYMYTSPSYCVLNVNKHYNIDIIYMYSHTMGKPAEQKKMV